MARRAGEKSPGAVEGSDHDNDGGVLPREGEQAAAAAVASMAGVRDLSSAAAATAEGRALLPRCERVGVQRDGPVSASSMSVLANPGLAISESSGS